MKCFECILSVGIFLICQQSVNSSTEEKVNRWAKQLGTDIWTLGLDLTKAEQIKKQFADISVGNKNGSEILDSALTSVGRMLSRKIDAVKCIYHAAKNESQNYIMTEEKINNTKYCSSKNSERFLEDTADNMDGFLHGDDWQKKIPKSARENFEFYKNMSLHEDSHFYNLRVTTDDSCVHVPTNIYDRHAEPLEAILWSESLNEIFEQNYKSDPSLIWQYFGSSTGVLRLFPGMPWNEQKKADTFDCRVRSWYIEAATCSKDLIVLFDVSGSMTGSNNYVARNTLKALLKTLSNNDYINVFYFKNGTKEVVDCFENLVQATPENLKTLRETLEPIKDGKTFRVPLEGYANMTVALIKAFDTLREVRQTRPCGQNHTGCNQLIAVISDSVPKNYTDLFMEYNREMIEDNETFIPVRIFTYLIGKEVTNVPEAKWVSCFNRGYFSHVRGIEDVQQQVLKYINVIARPMILEGTEPPPTWTHAYIDDTRTKDWSPKSSDVAKDDSDKLVTSVAIPVFDDRMGDDSQNISAKLIGVAGTDVPIDSIAKLTVPHKLGVNGYSFIVSNNGYVLLHPGLITSIQGRMQDNYNSVDFVEVEQIDDGKSVRELGDDIKKLRQAMVDADTGSLLNIPVLYHYDNMSRIVRVTQNYFYAPLKGTPFTIGISLPQGYGNTLVEVGDVFGTIEKLGHNITDYFRSNFRIHPDWVYCKHHYLENHETENPEHELFRFLQLMGTKNWTWSEQYNKDESEDEEFTVEGRCGRAVLDADAYYCNRDLVEGLIFDAKLTDQYYRTWSSSREYTQRAERYGVELRFVATMSGLTRWQYIFDEDNNESVDDEGIRHRNKTGESFAVHSKAIEETWYRAAVWQHYISPDSFVVSVPVRLRADVESEDDRLDNITVTASHAIFAKDDDAESPALVVGFEFSYSNLYERFVRMTIGHTKESDTDEITSCKDSRYLCYLVDSSGYMVASRRKNDVGGFIGVAEPNVVEEMLLREILTTVTVFDYQALCTELHPNVTASCSLFGNPFRQMRNMMNWFIGKLVFYLSIWNYNWVLATDSDFDSDQDVDYSMNNMSKIPQVTILTPEESVKDEKEPFSCDKEIELYILNQTLIDEEYEILSGGGEGNCTPSWWVRMVPHTNLMLLVVSVEGHDGCPKRRDLDTDKKPTFMSTQQAAPCHKVAVLGKLNRRRLAGCFTYNENEKYVLDCGRGSRLIASRFLLGVIALATSKRLFEMLFNN